MPAEHMVLQTVFDEHPGLLAVVFPDNEARGIFRLWDRGGLPEQKEFDTVDDARAWAEREYNISPDSWIPSDQAGSPLTLLDVLRGLLPRPFTCNEMCAAICLAYKYVALDERGLQFFPTAERCITSFNVVSDLPETLDWTREGCTLFDTDASSDYGLVSDVEYHALEVEASGEFLRIGNAITEAANVSAWLLADGKNSVWPQRLPVDAGPLAGLANAVMHHPNQGSDAWLSGYVANRLGVISAAHVVPTKTAAFRVRDQPYLGCSIAVVVVDGAIHILMTSGHEDREDMFSQDLYLTSADGVLLRAARRENDGPLEDVAVANVAGLFEETKRAWLEWLEHVDDRFWSPEHAPTGPVEVDGRIVFCSRCGVLLLPAGIYLVPVPVDEAAKYAIREACDACWQGLLDETIAQVESLDDESDDVFAFADLVQRRGLFIADYVSHAPAHVVKRAVLGTLRTLKSGLRLH